MGVRDLECKERIQAVYHNMAVGLTENERRSFTLDEVFVSKLSHTHFQTDNASYNNVFLYGNRAIDTNFPTRKRLL